MTPLSKSSASQVGVPHSGQHFEDVIVDAENGSIESTFTKIVDDYFEFAVYLVLWMR
jgi:hypothetical protein